MIDSSIGFESAFGHPVSPFNSLAQAVGVWPIRKPAVRFGSRVAIQLGAGTSPEKRRPDPAGDALACRRESIAAMATATTTIAPRFMTPTASKIDVKPYSKCCNVSRDAGHAAAPRRRSRPVHGNRRQSGMGPASNKISAVEMR